MAKSLNQFLAGMLTTVALVAAAPAVLAQQKDCDQGWINGNALAQQLIRTSPDQWNGTLLSSLSHQHHLTIQRAFDAHGQTLKRAGDSVIREMATFLKQREKTKDEAPSFVNPRPDRGLTILEKHKDSVYLPLLQAMHKGEMNEVQANIAADAMADRHIADLKAKALSFSKPGNGLLCAVAPGTSPR